MFHNIQRRQRNLAIRRQRQAPAGLENNNVSLIYSRHLSSPKQCVLESVYTTLFVYKKTPEGNLFKLFIKWNDKPPAAYNFLHLAVSWQWFINFSQKKSWPFVYYSAKEPTLQHKKSNLMLFTNCPDFNYHILFSVALWQAHLFVNEFIWLDRFEFSLLVTAGQALHLLTAQQGLIFSAVILNELLRPWAWRETQMRVECVYCYLRRASGCRPAPYDIYVSLLWLADVVQSVDSAVFP